MKTARRISAQDLITDIQSGMAASELIGKYNLSPGELQFLVGKLTSTTGRSLAELYGRSGGDMGDDEAKRMRVLPRHVLKLPVPIHDVNRPQVSGVLLDITEKGFRTQGIETGIEEVKTFLILADQFFPVNPFKLQAVCRWARPTDDDRKCIAGFERTAISSEGLRDLRLLVKSLYRAREASLKAQEISPQKFGPQSEAQAAHVWTCPFCKMPQMREFDECPQCGIITSKYLARQQRSQTELLDIIQRSPAPEDSTIRVQTEAERFVRRSLYISNKIWKELEAMGGVPDDHVNEALASYLLKNKVGKRGKR